jgi:hypothetical protein
LAPIDRRTFLIGLGAGAGFALARGLGARELGAGGRALRGLGAPPPGDFDATLRMLGASLSPFQRAHIVLPADHPSRQVDNTIAVLERPHLGTLLSPVQRALVERLYAGMLSERGRQAFAGTVAVEGRLDGCVLAIYGEPRRGAAHAQVVISGGHLLLRGGARAMGAAFGGGIAYGHQVGDHRWRVAGNSFAYQGDAANRLYAALSGAERARARLAAPPHELVLQPQGAGARIPGVPLGALAEPAREAAAQLLDAVFSCYPEPERAEAHACLDAQGGVDALHFSVYESHGFYEDMRPFASLDAAERARRGDPYWQVWRLEGPGAVIHFQGHPHVHAYVHVVRDPGRANLGESLGRADAPLEGEAMRGLLEAALRRATGEPLAFYGPDVPGRFCAGEITTGLVWALDPYRNRIALATIAGRAMAAPLRERLTAAGAEIEPGRRYRVATTDWHAGRADLFGEPEDVTLAATLVRDALIAHLRAGGLPS